MTADNLISCVIMTWFAGCGIWLTIYLALKVHKFALLALPGTLGLFYLWLAAIFKAFIVIPIQPPPH